MAKFAKLYSLDAKIPVKKERLAKLYGLDARIPPRIKVYGDREVRAALKALGGAVRRKILVHAMVDAMKPMLKRAIAEAPRDSGRLAGNIKLVFKGEEKGRMRVDVIATKAEVAYLGPVEYGAPGRDRLPDEFMLRAFDAESGAAKDAVQRKIVEGIGREAEGLR